MSASPRYCPGTPAVFTRTYDASLNLQGLADALQVGQPHLVWLDSARVHRVTGRFSILGWDPWLSLCASGDAITLTTSASHTRMRGNPLDALRQTLARYAGPCDGGAPPAGLGLLGFLSYDLNRWIERLPVPKPPPISVPDLFLCGMRMLVVVDHALGRSWCLSVVDPHRPGERARREAAARLEQFEELRSLVPSADAGAQRLIAAPELTIESAMSQTQFEAMVHRAKAFIQAGDIFQANLSHCVQAAWRGCPWQLYLALRQVNPSPFACFVQWPGHAIVSCSPERLVQVRDGQARARPIAGTRPRGASPEEDLVKSLELILSDKERAEHIMLVDLARNDLGRVCRSGSVTVDELMVLEDYSHVIHIVSNVRGFLREGIGAAEVIRAMFPGGTITGCPKVRCMELLHELEPVGRGLYTGSVGYLGFDGSLDLSILIRTMVAQAGRLAFHVGAGIVADSQPDREYRETLDKAAALVQAIQTCLPRDRSGHQPLSPTAISHDAVVH